MFKLLKYLKKYTLSLILVIMLLIVQATLDLSLPTYTSNIVNIGIEQGGIDSNIPIAIRESEIKTIFLLSSKQEKRKILDNYELVKQNNQNYIKKYPTLKTENIYIYKNNKDKEFDFLMGKKLLLLKIASTPDEKTMQILSPYLPSDDKNYALKDIIDFIPNNVKTSIIDELNNKVNDMPELIINQASKAIIKSEYQSLNINTDKIQNDYILKTGLEMLGIALLSMLSTIGVGLFGARVAAGLARDLREKVFTNVVKFSNKEFKYFSTASLITRSTNDIQQICMAIIAMARTIFYAPIMGFGGVMKVLNTNTSMAWILGLAVISIIFIITTLFIIVMPKFNIIQKLVDKINLVSREILSGIPVIRAFSTEKYEEKRFDKANQELTKVSIFVNRTMALMMPLMSLIMNSVTILIVYEGSKGIDNGIMQVGDMMAFIQYSMQIIISFLMISMISIMLPRANISSKRVIEVIETKSSIQDKDEVKPFDETKKGLVEFKNVSFKYPDADENVLSNITFTAIPGQTTAIIGSTGSGKSTLVNLIPRFFDVTEGEVLVEGQNVKDVKQKDLRRKIGYVPQKAILFSGNIKSNIKYGNENITDDVAKKALDIAQADFVYQLQEKENSPISQGGSNVSGGQKQRLSIARAIAINPSIYIFDDSFSALDFKTDANLRKALSNETSGSTVLIVAQRISTIMHAEQIIVLDNGKIVGIGKHDELLKNCQVYKQIAESQLSKEELIHE